MEQNLKGKTSSGIIFKKSVSILKNNFPLLLKVYLVLGLVQLGSELYQFYIQSEAEKVLTGGNFDYGRYQMFLYGKILISIVVFAVLCRVMVAYVRAVKKSYFDEERSYKLCMIESKKMGWDYFGAAFLLGLMALPTIIPMMIYRFSEIVGVQIVMLLMTFAWMMYLHFNYSFGVYITAYKPEEQNKFEYSKTLFKNNRMKYLGVNLITIVIVIIAMLPVIIPIIVNGTAFTSMSMTIIDWLFNSAVVMFSTVMIIVSIIEFEKTLDHAEIKDDFSVEDFQ